MSSFLSDVITDLKEKHQDLSQLTIILPSKRAGAFFREEQSRLTDNTSLSPKIIAIEDFVIEISKLQPLTSIELLFEFYNVYKTHTPKNEIESLDQFSSWSKLLLNDFNEIDRYLIDAEKLFNYLGAIKELNHWSLENNQTDNIKKYISFWKRLLVFYKTLTSALKTKQKGFQGMIYREAVNHLKAFASDKKEKELVFVGFNALNKAEEKIIHELLNLGVATAYWDIDNTFINNPIHDAGLFVRQYKKEWNYYNSNPFLWAKSTYSSPKTINIIGAPKQVGQVKYIGNLLKVITASQIDLNKTAVVLGDESLMLPLLNSIPSEVKSLNITMGLTINNTPLSSLFDLLFTIQKDYKNSFYYKDLINLFSNPFIKIVLDSDSVLTTIQANNLTHIHLEKLLDINSIKNAPLIRLMLADWENDPKKAIDNFLELIISIKKLLDDDKVKAKIELEYLFCFNKIFNELKRLSETTNYLTDIKTLHGLYRELIQTERIDFEGNPFSGLQIMGMLETRVLDFETVIISSVNEGVLPAGKTNNSFIPFDVKKQYDLPTYKEKDAIYTYHFYRLLQRAKNIYILYDTEGNSLNGGEPSRFIKQLELEGIHTITKKIATPKTETINDSNKTLVKSKAILEDLKLVANKGFSPSALTNYIRNPIDFYYENLLGIKMFDEVEETLASKTLGNIIHKTLEDLYAPIIGKELTIDHLKAMQLKVNTLITKHFNSEYKKGDFTKGKNLISFEVAKRYVQKFLTIETNTIKDGNTIEIIALERSINAEVFIPQLGFPVKIRGIVDRIDCFNGTVRIIDYKTGKVEQNKVEIVNWNEILTDYDKYSKSFQVLSYAYMLRQDNSLSPPFEAGIISFKNLKEGFLKFGKKESTYSRTKAQLITEDTLNSFEIELKKLILEICNPDIPFIEKDV